MAKNIPGSPVRLRPKEPAANFRTGWTQGLWICAGGIPATSVCLAYKDATTVCPPPLLDVSADYASKCAGSDLDTTAGCQRAGTQIDGRAVKLYVSKCGRVLIN